MGKVLLMSGSPRAGGNTDDCVAYVEKKFTAAGHSTTLVRVCDLRIEPCRGCRACMTLQRCAIEGDEFERLWGMVKASDLVVVAAPIYWSGPPGPMKNFVDRTHGYYTAPRPLAGLKGALLSVAADDGCWEPHEAVLSSWLRVYGAQLLPGVRILAREKGEALASAPARRSLTVWAETLLGVL